MEYDKRDNINYIHSAEGEQEYLQTLNRERNQKYRLLNEQEKESVSLKSKIDEL